MKNYVFVTNQDGHAYYLSEISGQYVFSDVNHAMRFDLNEIADVIRDDSSFGYLGFSVIRIEDVTFEKLKIDEALQRRYSDFLQVAR